MKHLLLSILLPLLAFTVVLSPVSASAACPSGSSSKAQVLDGVGKTGSKCDDSGVAKTINGVVNILSFILGVAAIIMILVSAFKYITSNGDSNKIAGAKSTLIYALVGLAVAALAQVFVNFVMGVTK